MNVRLMRTIACAVVGASAIGACADSAENDPAPSEPDGGAPEATPDEAGPESRLDAFVDADALCTTDDFCRTTLPDPAAFGTEALDFFAIVVDPDLGTLAATRPGTNERGTSQILQYDGQAWIPYYSMYGVDGYATTTMSAFVGDGHGHAMALDTAGMVVRFDKDGPHPSRGPSSLLAAWVSETGTVFALGNGVYRSSLAVGDADAGADGGTNEWTLEPLPPDVGYCTTIWGSGEEVWLAGYYEGQFLSVSRRRATATEVTYDTSVFLSVPLMPIVGHGSPGGSSLLFAKEGAARATVAIRLEQAEQGELSGRIQTAFPVPMYSIMGPTLDDYWTVGEAGRAYRFNDDKTTDATFAFGAIPLTNTLRAIAGDGEGGTWIVGTGIALRKRAR